jgi:hypothetical protein
MRRLWATAVSGAIILLSAGCTTEPAATTGAPTPAVGAVTEATPAPGVTAQASDPAGDAALASNTGAICKQAAKTSGDAAKMLEQNRKLVADAASAKDKFLVQKVTEKAERDVQNWGFALTDMSRLVADTEVKKALGEVGAEISKIKGDFKKIDDAKVASLRKAVDKACGKG